MTKKNVKLPGCGLLLAEDFESGDAWRKARYELAVGVIEEVGRLLSECDDVEELAERLNRLFAPFNVYDYRDGAANFVVVVPTKYIEGRGEEEGLQFQLFFRGEIDVDAPDDYREITRHGEFWYDSDAALTEEDLGEEYSAEERAEFYEEVAERCLEIAYWANLKEVNSAYTPQEFEALQQAFLSEFEG